MDIKEIKSEKLERHYEVHFSSEEVQEKIDQKLSEVSKKLKIDGFRPGKVPLKILKDRGYEDRVQKEVLESMITEGVQKAIQDHKLRIALQPEVTPGPFKKGEAFIVTARVEILPSLDPIDVSTLQATQHVAPVAESQITKVLDGFRNFMAELKVLDENVEVQPGHVVHLSFQGSLDGKDIPEATSDGMDLEIGSKTFIDGFEDQLIGLKVGAQKEFEITFPQDYGHENLAGKKVLFKISVKEVKEKTVPELTEEFAKSMNHSSLEDMRAWAKTVAEEDNARMSFLDGKKSLMDYLADQFSFDLPQGLVKLEFDSIWAEVQKELAQQSKAQQETSEKGKKQKKEKGTQKTEEDLKKEYYEIAERRVRLGLLIAEIGAKHNITVPQKDFEEALRREILKYPGSERQVISYYRDHPQAQAALKAPLFEDRVMQWLLEHVKLTKKEISHEELVEHFRFLTEDDEEDQ